VIGSFHRLIIRSGTPSKNANGNTAEIKSAQQAVQGRKHQWAEEGWDRNRKHAAVEQAGMKKE